LIEYQNVGPSIAAAHWEARTVLPKPAGATRKFAIGAGDFSRSISLSLRRNSGPKVGAVREAIETPGRGSEWVTPQ